MQYFNESAEYGNTEALFALGFMHSTGKGVPVNKPLSLLYYAFASQGGNRAATLTLGYKYYYGHGVVKSCTKAVQKYEIVASKVIEQFYSMYGSSFGGYHNQITGEQTRLSDGYGNEATSHKERQHEEEDIVQYYQYSADTGDFAAQVTMGTLYLQGAYGVPRDYNRAFQYFQQAATIARDPAALSNLGFMYANGLGVLQDNETAVKYYKEAAEKGNPHAQTNLGYMFMHGYGVPKNPTEAVRYFKLAADQGHAEGQLNLGNIYYSGYSSDGHIVLKQDYGRALNYFSLAAQQGHPLAIFNLAQMHHYGLGTQSSCSLAVQLYKRVAERGLLSPSVDPSLSSSVSGVQLESPPHVLEEAFKLFQSEEFQSSLILYELAAEQGVEVAQSNAGWMYDSSLGLPLLFVPSESPEKATQESNNQNTQLKKEKQFRMAFEYYRNSAEQKNALSLQKIGDYYYDGRGTMQSKEKAALYYQAASDMRNAQSMFNLGYMHQHGIGLPKDLHLAKRFYDMSLQTDPDSYIAVYICLILLAFQFLYTGVYSDSLQIWGLKWDSLLIIFLTVILFVCIIIKQLRLLQ